MDYREIFCGHINRLMRERGLSQLELAQLADVSISFISDITQGKANPSLKIMTALAKAFNIPLPLLLMKPDGELWQLLSNWEVKPKESKPVFDSMEIKPGFEEIKAILPSSKAYVVRKWAEQFQEKWKNKK